jgi:hypothetical protein
MGLSKFFARRFAVGGTARLFAKQYNWFKKNKFKPGTSDTLIYNEIIMLRFKYPHSKKLFDMVSNGEIKDLKDLVIETLSIEAGYRENSIENQIMYDEVIEEELLKKGIPLK